MTAPSEVLHFDARSGVRRRAGDRRADRDPVPRRARGRRRDAPDALASAVAQAGAGDAADRGDRRRWRRTLLAGLTWTECVPARRAAVADRPGAVLERRDQSAGPADRAPLAEPRVGAQRRAGAARPCWCSPPRSAPAVALRLVAVRAREPGDRVRRRPRRRASSAARLMPRGTRGLADGIPPHQKSLYALGVACAAYGIAVLTPHGNGLIAVYVAAITLGIQRPDIRGLLRAPGRRPGGDRQARHLRRVRRRC